MNYFWSWSTSPCRPCTTWCCRGPPPPARTCRAGRCRARARRRSLSPRQHPALSSSHRLQLDRIGGECPGLYLYSWKWYKLYVIYKDKLQYFLSSTQQKKTVEEKSIETFPKSLDWLKYFKQTFNQNFRSVWTFYSHWALSSRHHYNIVAPHTDRGPAWSSLSSRSSLLTQHTTHSTGTHGQFSSFPSDLEMKISKISL